MPTLAALIADHEQHQEPTPLPSADLTPRGHAVVAIDRLEDQIRALGSAEDRGYALGMLHAVLGELMALDANA
jgi:hypothetical protein